MKKQDPNIYMHIFEQLSAGALIVDHQGNIININPAFSELTEYPYEEVIGKHINHFLDGPYPHNENWEGNISVKRKKSYPLYQWLYITPIKDKNDDVTHRIFIIRDFHVYGYDPLTKLPNRHILYDHLRKSIKTARLNQTHIAVLFLDLDRFKFVNDTLGHATGDYLLKEATKRIQEATSKHTFICRMGGDEFVVVLENIIDEKCANRITNNIIDAFSKPFIVNNTELFITTSIGVSIFPYDGDDPEMLVTNADSAMYLAKKKGKNLVQRFIPNESAGAFEKLLLENSLRHAIQNNELTLYFQPQIDIQSNELTSLEALIRWIHPELGLISPGEFIPIAEETDLILKIDEWVLRTACQKMREWQDAGLPPLRVAVNLSSAQFVEKNLVEKVDDILKETNLEPAYLELEITENMIMKDIKTGIETLKKLKERGVHLSIDDFGTGYSSLNYLKELPVHTLKIDRSFIKDIDRDKSSLSLTKAIVNLAHDLELKVIAEGVENKVQLSLVKEHACDAVQGYIFSKPLNDKQIIQFINNWQKEQVISIFKKLEVV